MYDPAKLTKPEDCLTVMTRARERGLDDVYASVLRRYCELTGSVHDDPTDPIVRDMWEGIAAYEAYLFQKHGGKNIKASYTRRKIARKGVVQSMIEWTRDAKETEGFHALLQIGLPELTGEYLVVKHAPRFPDDVVTLARSRLHKYNIPLPI